MLKGRVLERVGVQRRIVAGDLLIDRPYLRRLVLDGLRNEFGLSASRDPKSAKAWTRCWLLSSLGRLSDGDRDAIGYLKEQLEHDAETNRWARYWGLEGLVTGKVAETDQIAKAIVVRNGDPLVTILAKTILASHGDLAMLEDVKQALEQEYRWRAIRALRVVPLEETIDTLIRLVRSDDINDDMYDAIVALGAVSPESSSTDSACHALIERVKLCRLHPWWDSLRSKALAALGCLRCPDAVPVLVAELSDSNPSIVSEAAHALEQILGTSVATERIVEAAAAAGPQAVEQYAGALRWMNREQVVQALEELMTSGSDEEEQMAPLLLREIGGQAAFNKLRARADSARKHLALMEEAEKGIRDTFDSVLQEARSGYRVATYMDAATFLLGVGMLGLSAFLIVSGKETLGGFAGTGGALGVIYSLFFANPRTRVQGAVQHLMTMKIIFLAYLRQLHQADQAFVRRYLEEGTLDPVTLAAYSDLITNTMRNAIAQVREPSARSTASEPEEEDEVPDQGGKRRVRASGAVRTGGATAEPPSRPAKIAG
jgi:HEAT repeat protein